MIKKRNLDPSLVQWIQSQSNIPLAIMGDIFYLAPAASATSQFRAALEDQGIPSENIYTTLASVYAATVTRRNDVIIAAPGHYNVTSSLTWAKDNIHLIGAGIGLPHTDQYLTTGVPNFYTTTTTVGEILNITGERNSFHNASFFNGGNHATNYQGVKLDGYGNSFFNCQIVGNAAANQRSSATCCSLNIAAGGFYPLFEDCLIGSEEWGARSAANSGQLYFSGNTNTSMPSHGVFRRCIFRSHGTTNTVCMVKTYGQYSANFYWLFDNCLFHHHWTNWVDQCTRVFYFPTNIPTHDFIMKDSVAVGYDQWQDKDLGLCVCGAMPQTGDGGGLAELLDEAVES